MAVHASRPYAATGQLDLSVEESRAGVIANWDAVFDAARQRGVAIEIDGDRARQDLDDTMASRPLEAGWPIERLLVGLSGPASERRQ